MGLRVLWRIIVTQHSLPLKEMQLEIVFCILHLLLLMSSEINRKTVEMCSMVRRVHISACFWEKWMILCAKDENNLYICEGTINAEAYVGILERHMLPSQWRLFPGTPCLFQQDDARQVTTAWLCRHRGCVLDWPACSPDLSPIENICRIMKRWIRQRAPRSAKHQEWGKHSTCKTVTIDIFSSQTISKCN